MFQKLRVLGGLRPLWILLFIQPLRLQLNQQLEFLFHLLVDPLQPPRNLLFNGPNWQRNQYVGLLEWRHLFRARLTPQTGWQRSTLLGRNLREYIQPPAKCHICLGLNAAHNLCAYLQPNSWRS